MIICGGSTTHLKGANILNRTNLAHYFCTPEKCMIMVRARHAAAPPAKRRPRTIIIGSIFREDTMSELADILEAARARIAPAPYAGAVTPREAYALLAADAGVKLIDVRTNAER